MRREIQVWPSKGELVQAAAEMIVEAAGAAIAARGQYALALSGGGTPRDAYELLAGLEFRDRIDWQRLHVFWGDERTVPPDHPDSNFGMAEDALLARIDIPEQNIHRMRGELPPAQAAQQYQADLESHFGDRPIRFDLVLLGLGQDGHTASLFPGTTAVKEATRSVTEVFVPGLDTWRITLTLPVINAARAVVFLVAGASKAEVVKEIMRSAEPMPEHPASLVWPKAGGPVWMLDAEAASLI